MFFTVLIILLFVLLCLRRPNEWEEFRQRFSDIEGDIKFYNLREVGDERHFLCRKHRLKYAEVFDNPNRCDTSTCMIKAVDGPIVEHVRQRITASPKDAVTVKIQTSPWKYQAHFDCVNQMIHVLHGEKLWLLFDLAGWSHDEELELLEAHKGKGVREWTNVLGDLGVPYELRRTKAGDRLFLAKGWYHVVENVGERGVIFANVSLDEADVTLTERFRRLWPMWFVHGQEIVV